MSILLKATYRFDAIPSKYPDIFLIEIEKKNLKTCMGHKKTPNNQTTQLFKLYFVLLNKVLWYWHKHRHIDECNRKPRNKPTDRYH